MGSWGEFHYSEDYNTMTFISVESLDGGGSTTVVESIGKAYADTVTTSEPSDLEYGHLVRRNLSQDTDPIVDFYLFMADRRDHIENIIKPAEENSKLVVSDRYSDSTRAYQPVALAGESDTKPFDSSWEAKSFIEKSMAPWNYEPDLTIYIQISVETALERAEGDEKYEKREFLEEVKANYDALADTTDRIVTIDGEQSKEEVFRDAFAKVDMHIH